MSTIKLFSTDEKTKGLTVTLTIVGEVTFDKEKNFIEVDEEKGEALLKRQFGMTLQKEEDLIPKYKKPVEEESEHKEMLSALDDKDLKDLLKDYPEKETKKLTTREKIIGFLDRMMTKK